MTKSLVVQESLAVHLLARGSMAAAPASPPPVVSENYRAFADAGLIGGVALGQGAGYRIP